MALLIVTFLLISLPIFLLFLLQNHSTKNRRLLRLPPGPKGLPLIGNLHQFDHSNPPRYLWKLSTQYGPLVYLRLGSSLQTLIVSSAKMAKEVYKIHDLEFSGRPFLIGQQKLSYNGLDLAFSPYNANWRELRKICVMHLFNSNRVQQFRPAREEEVSRMIEKISKSSYDDHDCKQQPIDLGVMMLSFTSSFICRIAFGKRYEDEGSEIRRFHAMLSEAQFMLGSFFFSDLFPFMGWLDKLTGMVRRLKNSFEELETFYQELINEHLDPNRSKTEHEEDIIDVLLQLRKESGFKFDISLDHIKGVLMNVFVGGTDASVATVVWAMTYLMKNPNYMKKAQEEIRHIMGNKDFVNEDDIQNLPYLKAVVKETMRLQPAAPLSPRSTTEKCNLEGYEIPAKTLVFVNAFAIGRDPEAWENAEEFNPDRFIGSCIDLKGQNFELVPFGGGRRSCPGIYMGIAMVELALANLLHKFDWELPAGMKKEDLDFEVLPGITMHKKNTLFLIARNYI
ncbi:hypothetical protein EZV62_021265 [Acer yangbiense]|uniref:Cytochrome P450 n=1 Tax=Acer yangbiense TaxID=1000413 RepID=A0A5C7H7A4_9ROSI|nr:hypothetical protein EZV62_021265 [Acer yangbiense]